MLDHGRIIERGSHDALIEQKGQYYQLYTGAFELEYNKLRNRAENNADPAAR